MLGKAGFTALAIAVLLCPLAALANEARVLDSTNSEIVIELATDHYSIEKVDRGGEPFFRVTARGYGTTTEAGLPRLPAEAVLVGVPFGAEIRLDVVEVDAEGLGPHRVEPAPVERAIRDDEFRVPVQEFDVNEDYYADGPVYPGAAAELGFDAVLRNQRVVQVVFHPFSYSPRSNALAVRKRIVARLSFEPSVPPPGMMPVGVDEREWSGVYSGTVLNHHQAKAWRLRPEPRRSGVRPEMRRYDEAYKLVVEESGVHRLSYSELASAGLDGTPDMDDVGVFQRSYDEGGVDPFVETAVPIVAVDSDRNGVFDGSDYVLFFAQSFEDQWNQEGYRDRYANQNVYWFGWGEDVALRMGARPAWYDEEGLVAPSSFRDTVRFEEDVYFDSEQYTDYVDFYTWTSYVDFSDNYQLPFSIHDVDPGGDIYLRARCQGKESGLHELQFRVKNGNAEDNWVGTFQFSGISISMSEDIFETPPGNPIPASYFTDGDNTFRSIGEDGGSGANVDWFEFNYERYFSAHDGRLAFTNDRKLGISQFGVGGFTSEDVRLFDVTDPWDPVVLTLGEGNIEPDGMEYNLVFQDSLDSFTRYEALQADGYLSISSVERREPANLFDVPGGADLIVVSHEDFADGVETLLERRRQQGFTVVHAPVTDVYDEFGGGMPSPEAIRSYFKYAFQEWSRQPQFALLVGDTSEDTRGVLSESSPNFVPSYIYAAYSGDDLVASDEWYVCFDDAWPYLPQMYIGRLPVGTATELSMDVSKILAYEDYSPDDEWRNNVFFIADDLWSYVTLQGMYERKEYEGEFTRISLALADTVAASPAGIDTTLVLLRRYTDPYHGETTEGDAWYALQTKEFVEEEVTPGLRTLLGGGAVIVNFQGHGNRTLMTHENLITRDDLPLTYNNGRPFIFLGFSCQLARIHYWSEGIPRVGDSIVERMLHVSADRGAVAAFASSGIEFLGANVDYNECVFDAFFNDPTPEGLPSEYFWPRWSLGGILAKATVKYVTRGRGTSAARTFMFLGDPLMHIEMSPPTIRVTVDGNQVVSGDYVAPTAEGVTALILADLIDEVEIDPTSISVAETGVGEVDPEDYDVSAVGDTLGQQSRWYRVSYDTEIRDENYDITVAATDVNGQTASFVLRVAGGRTLRIEDVANHPNPFTRDTRIIYKLNQQGTDVVIRIYTVGGRLIHAFDDAPNDLSYNEFLWDGTDSEGDRVANGVYLYTIDVTGEDGASVSAGVGRMVKVK